MRSATFLSILRRAIAAIESLERAAVAVELMTERTDSRPVVHAADITVSYIQDGRRRVDNLADILACQGIPGPLQIQGTRRDSRRLFLRVSKEARRDIRELSRLMAKISAQGIK